MNRARRPTVRTALVAASVVVLLVVAVVLAVRWDRMPWHGPSWRDGESHGRWTVLYTGYGTVTGTDRRVTLAPRAADDPQTTHGALVHTRETYRDADFTVRVRTEEQLRHGEPNVWEVGWVLWNLRDTSHFYAVALKPNGWEISKQDPAYPGEQRFLVTGEDRTFPIGREYTVTVAQDWPRMTVSVDGTELATVVDTERPYRGGAVGLYTEDARVAFSDLRITSDGA